MASVEGKTPQLKKRPPRDNESTIMIIGRRGRVRSLNISRRFLFISIIFFLLYIFATLFVINEYFTVKNNNDHQSDKIKGLEEELLRYRNELHRSNRHVALLKDYIRQMENPKTEVTDLDKKEDQDKRETTPKKEVAVGGTAPKDWSNGRVSIGNMAFQREGSRMIVDFNVVNSHPGENPVRGYIHLIAFNRDNKEGKRMSFPKVTLLDGVPTVYKKGQPFLIQRFKPVRGRFDLSDNEPLPSTMRVMVYEQSGQLILEKDFDIDDLS
jgi:hypothetical protein